MTGSAVQSGSGESGSPYVIEAGGSTVVTSLTRPATPFQGQRIFETDTGRTYEYISSDWEQTSDPTGILEPAICQVSMSAVQAIADSTNTTVLFNTEDLDPRNWHSTSLNTGRITPNIAGWYEVSVAYDWASDADYTRRLLEVHKNGAAPTPTRRSDLGSANVATGVQSDTITSALIEMNGSTDYFTINAFQSNSNAGANNLRVVFKAELKYRT